ncbi:MAG: hypothetical protein HKM93_18675 [Desulfobacteraceae bacterium]|nr:hypothetical protein [Desulfobacteraceae bacterium]
MPITPRITYSIGDAFSSDVLANPHWLRPMPLGRNRESGQESGLGPTRPVYKDYFEALRSFLTHDNFKAIRDAVREQSGHGVRAADLTAIDISLLKHGQYYHPSSVTVSGKGVTSTFVINAAISRDGRQLIDHEFHCIDRLNSTFPISFLPQVYAFGEGAWGDSDRFPMFLGEWFSGYNEFHLTGNPDTGDLKVVVWDEDEGHFDLSKAGTAELIRRAAMILSTYYNPLTFEQIQHWHHAAGDFVVKMVDGRPDLKLITVRDYAPLIRIAANTGDTEHDLRTMLTGCLLFFLNLSLKMRIDRIDGVGEMALYAPDVLKPVWEGFQQGLDLSCRIHQLPEGVHEQVIAYIRSCPAADLAELMTACSKRYGHDSPERKIIGAAMGDHIESITGLF